LLRETTDSKWSGTRARRLLSPWKRTGPIVSGRSAAERAIEIKPPSNNQGGYTTSVSERKHTPLFSFVSVTVVVKLCTFLLEQVLLKVT
jgi:hypothetical protein